MEQIKITLVLLIAAVFSFGAKADEYSVQSPDGKYKVVFSDHNDCVAYSLSWNGRQVIAPSRLGVKTVTEYCDGLKIKTFQAKGETDVTWKPVYGERSLIRDHYNEYLIELDAPINIEVRAYDIQH